MAKSVLVVPGTGKQGRLVAQELLRRGYAVSSLARNPSSASAHDLKHAGAIIHAGDLGDQSSIEKALDRIDAVFLALPAHPTNEITFAQNVIQAAQKKGIKHLLYTSVARTGQHKSFPFWSDEYPLAWYWKNKQTIEELLRAAKFQFLTILRPGFFMQNFCRPEVEHMFPGLAETHTLTVPFNEDTKFDLIDINDIAKFVVASIEDPQKFANEGIELAGEKLTASEIARVLGKISGSDIDISLISKEDSEASAKQGNFVTLALEFQRDVGYGVSLEKLRRFGIELTPLSKALTNDSLKW